jgi:hypothetical protein
LLHSSFDHSAPRLSQLRDEGDMASLLAGAKSGGVMRRSILLLAAFLVAVLGAMAAKSVLIDLPPPRQAPAGVFDAHRAKARLAFVLGDERPHPTDTVANDQVRDRIVGLLTGMGLAPVIRDQLACNELYKSRGVSCARIRNVIATLGPAGGKAVLLSAHYDSTPSGPGAGDAGIGVATLLEVAALLKQQPPKRPVILLFNEGEELGLVGARAFLADPLSESVDSLVNLEARGVRGPVNMFETSRPNGAAIKVFSSAAERPFANSLSTDVYRLMPNYTDVNTFEERRWLTLNLAPIGNETRYHSAGDNLAALAPSTLQHMGDQTLAIARELGSGTPAASGERIFMDVSGRMLITLPLVAGAVLLVALLAAFAALTFRRGAPWRALGVAAGTLVGSALLSWLVLAAIGAVRHGMFWRAHPHWTTLGAYACALLVASVLIATVGRSATVRQLRPGAWLLFLLVGAVILLFAPGGIIFFLFPPLGVLAGMVASRWWRRAELAGSVAAIVFLYVTWGAMLALLEELLNSGPMWVFAPLGALLILPPVIEAKPLIAAVRLRGAAAVAGALALLLWTISAAAPAYSADRQQRFVIEHVTDASSGKASWSVLNGKAPLPAGYADARDWSWGKLPYSEAQRWLAPAPGADMKAPAVELVASIRNGSERTLVVRLRPNGAERMQLIAPKDARIRAAGVRGFVRPIDPAADAGRYAISCSGRSCEGLELTIVQGRTEPTLFTLVGARSGLPPSAQPLAAARPKFARPQYAPDQIVAFTRVRL